MSAKLHGHLLRSKINSNAIRDPGDHYIHITFKLTCVYRPDKCISTLHTNNIRDRTNIKLGSNTWQKVLQTKQGVGLSAKLNGVKRQ